MEFMPYGDLQKYMPATGETLPLDQTQDLISQILEGLFYMHENGFAHRDLKPAVRFADFNNPVLNLTVIAERSCKVEATGEREMVG